MKHLCMNCSDEDKVVEFDNKADWMAHLKTHKEKGETIRAPQEKKEEPKKEKEPEPPPERPKAPPPEPLVLQYKYDGQCIVCRSAVDTLHIDVQDGMIAVAYCPNCKKQLKQQQVIPIDKQVHKKTVGKGKKKSY